MAGPSTTSPGAGRRPLPAGTTRRQLRVGGSVRSYLIHVPPRYDGVSPLPVVVTFHGFGANAQAQLALSGFASVADRNGFVVVAPESRGPGWDFLTPPSRPRSDAAFVVALLRDLGSAACIDARRRYATGISNGAAVVFALAYGDVGGFAAYGAVAGTFYSPLCDRAPPQPIVYFHGAADRLVPIDGGRVFGVTVAPASQTMGQWAAHNGCVADPRRSVITPDVTLLTWSGGRDGADVHYYTIAGGGHSWPGAPAAIGLVTDRFLGRTTQSISASQIMWDFFAPRSRCGPGVTGVMPRS
jgi:polyhydroxybutyrate depolymerase